MDESYFSLKKFVILFKKCEKETATSATLDGLNLHNTDTCKVIELLDIFVVGLELCWKYKVKIKYFVF